MEDFVEYSVILINHRTTYFSFADFICITLYLYFFCLFNLYSGFHVVVNWPRILPLFCVKKIDQWHTDTTSSWFIGIQILDSTEEAIESSLASTNHANVRTSEIYSKSLTTSCFTWLVIFVMTCIFIMVVLLIRVTWKLLGF